VSEVPSETRRAHGFSRHDAARRGRIRLQKGNCRRDDYHHSSAARNQGKGTLVSVRVYRRLRLCVSLQPDFAFARSRRTQSTLFVSFCCWFCICNVVCCLLQAQNPGKYIRYIYNRLILENSSVRAAAASSLVKFAQALPTTLGPSIAVLLRRCVHDEDDEVRDRATLYLGLLMPDSNVPTEIGNTVLSGEIGRLFRLTPQKVLFCNFWFSDLLIIWSLRCCRMCTRAGRPKAPLTLRAWRLCRTASQPSRFTALCLLFVCLFVLLSGKLNFFTTASRAASSGQSRQADARGVRGGDAADSAVGSAGQIVEVYKQRNNRQRNRVTNNQYQVFFFFICCFLF
jgi:hypothetical protein